MNKCFLLLACIFSSVLTGIAETTAPFSLPDLHTPGPPYPLAARAASITGLGTCYVVFGSSGHVRRAMMTKSTGSAILDENTVSFARKNWTGQPNTAISVPIAYKLAPATARTKPAGRLTTPYPPYPYQARAHHDQGRGIVKVTFDESGRPVSAVMTKSTGSSILDGNTVNYALKEWKSSGGKKTTISVPVAYRLQ